ncbi:MAG: hypothetical protein K2J67_02535 [Lachnospiraceae bacterium]|nr:hypothetical protein [Lachnospiraceae bacterium]
MEKKIKKRVWIGIAVLLAAALGMALFFFLRRHFADPLAKVQVNQPEDLKIKIDYVNSRRMDLRIYFPLDQYKLVTLDSYYLQQRTGNGRWKTLYYGGDTDTNHSSEWDESIEISTDHESGKYAGIGFATPAIDFLQDGGCLEAGKYRIVLPVKIRGKMYYLAAPFEISDGYDCAEEPTEYEYTTMVFADLDWVDDYENCRDYVNYDEFLSGFMNYTFNRDMYRHMTKIRIDSGGNSREISVREEMREVYTYFAGATLSRTGKEKYGSTFFADLDTLEYKCLDVPDMPETDESTQKAEFFFDYDGMERRMSCEIRGHILTVRTTDFVFDESASDRFPVKPLQPTEEKKEIELEYYVFNDLAKALEEYR